MKGVLSIFILVLSLLAVAGCQRTREGAAGSGFSLTSPAFANDSPIPARHSREGGNVSPPLAWAGVPEGTKSLALICVDPDAPGGDFTHWVAWDIPPIIGKLDAGQPKTAVMMCGGAQGNNDFTAVGWDGPSPPSGVHRYIFTLIALDTPSLPLEAGKCSRAALEKLLSGHEKGRTSLTGTFAR